MINNFIILQYNTCKSYSIQLGESSLSLLLVKYPHSEVASCHSSFPQVFISS